MLQEHVTALISLLDSEKFAILQARKFAKYYARHLPHRADFHARVNVCETYADFSALCTQYYIDGVNNGEVLPEFSADSIKSSE